jgi:hypothetical protein
MRLFNLQKTIKRNMFTKLFSKVGHRKCISPKITRGEKSWKRFRMQMIRRAHQGWRNKRIGSMQALKIRTQYGRRKPIAQFRR